MIQPLDTCGRLLEDAGATVLRRESPSVTGEMFSKAGSLLTLMSPTLATLCTGDSDGDLSSQRLAFAGMKMTEAGDQLQGIAKKAPTGKSWLKGR